MSNLTQKECTLLKDLKSQEKLCVEKYTKYSSEANDGQLKNLFTQIGQVERGHHETLTKIESGTTPSPASSGGSGGGQQPAPRLKKAPAPHRSKRTTLFSAMTCSAPKSMCPHPTTPAFSNSPALKSATP